MIQIAYMAPVKRGDYQRAEKGANVKAYGPETKSLHVVNSATSATDGFNALEAATDNRTSTTIGTNQAWINMINQALQNDLLDYTKKYSKTFTFTNTGTLRQATYNDDQTSAIITPAPSQVTLRLTLAKVTSSNVAPALLWSFEHKE